MNQTELTQLTDQELLEKKKKIRSGKITDAVIFGVMIGVAVYSTVRNGLGLLTFFPLLFLPIAAKNKKSYEAVDAEVKARNLG